MAMKDAVDSMPDERTTEPESFANRKLIRPSLNRNDHSHSAAPLAERRDRPERSNERNDRNDRNGGGRKVAPAEQTNAENFYYQKQMQARTPVAVVLNDGEVLRGTSSAARCLCAQAGQEEECCVSARFFQAI